MEEPLCNIDIVQNGKMYIAKIKTEFGKRKISAQSLENVFEQLFAELEDEFEGMF